MRAGRQARILERVLAADALEDLFVTSERDWRMVCRVLAGVMKGSPANIRAVAMAARLRGVSVEYVVDRVSVVAASLSAIRREDPYAVLGVSPTAPADAIQRRWRELAKTFHPDVAREPAAAETFQRLRQAYEILRDPERHLRWDARQLEHGRLSAHRATTVFAEALERDRIGWSGRAPLRRAATAARAFAGAVVWSCRRGVTCAAGAGRGTGRLLGGTCVAATTRGWRALREGGRIAGATGRRGGRAVAGLADGALARSRSGAATAASSGRRCGARFGVAGTRLAGMAVVVVRGTCRGLGASARGATALAAAAAAPVLYATRWCAAAASACGHGIVGLGALLERMAVRCRVCGALGLRAMRAAGDAAARHFANSGRLLVRAAGGVAAEVRAAGAAVTTVARAVGGGCRRVARCATAIAPATAVATAVLAILAFSTGRPAGVWRGAERVRVPDEHGLARVPAADAAAADVGRSETPAASVEFGPVSEPAVPSLMLATAQRTVPEPASAEPAAAPATPSVASAMMAVLDTRGREEPPTPARDRPTTLTAPRGGTGGRLRPADGGPAAELLPADAPGGAGGVARGEAAALVSTFRQHYEQRHVDELVGLFTEDGVENTRTGREAIAAAYRSALGPWRQITYRLGGLSYEDRADAIRVSSPFVITYGRPDGAQIVRGTAAWDLVRQDGDLRIAKLSYRVER